MLPPMKWTLPRRSPPSAAVAAAAAQTALPSASRPRFSPCAQSCSPLATTFLWLWLQLVGVSTASRLSKRCGSTASSLHVGEQSTLRAARGALVSSSLLCLRTHSERTIDRSLHQRAPSSRAGELQRRAPCQLQTASAAHVPPMLSQGDQMQLFRPPRPRHTALSPPQWLVSPTVALSLCRGQSIRDHLDEYVRSTRSPQP